MDDPVVAAIDKQKAIPSLTRRRLLQAGAAGSVAIVATFVIRESASAVATWTVWSPMTTASPWCASDYSGRPDDALDIGGAGGGFGVLKFTAGPRNGWGYMSSFANSCSTTTYPSHRRMTISLWTDDSPVQYVGGLIASHVVPWLAENQWAWGGGTAFCKVGAGGTPLADCWTGTHIHYGHVEGGDHKCLTSSLPSSAAGRFYLGTPTAESNW